MNSSTDDLGSQSGLFPMNSELATLLLLVPAVVLLGWFTLGGGGSKEPPSLKGGIPIITNTYQYMTDMQGFLNRVEMAQKTSPIIKFRLGPKKIYMVSGEKNISTINTPSPSISPDTFFLEVMRNVWHAKPSEVLRFAADKSGRAKRPISGQEVKPGQERLWHGQHHVYSEFLQAPKQSAHLAETFLRLFNEKLEKQGGEVGEWQEDVSLCDFFQTEMAEAGLVAIMGRRIVELNPGFWPAMWEFARLAPQLMWGLPQWVNPAPYKIRKEFHGMCRKYVDAAKAEGGFSEENRLDWDPRYGAKLGRELLRWADGTLSPETMAGMAATFIFGTNANSVPMCTWAMMELIADPDLYGSVREECLAASDLVDPATGERKLDPSRLMAMPLLQSVYLETLRLHVSINVTREVTSPIVLEGYRLSAGSLIQAPSQIGAYNEAVWGSPGHPAKEFWAGRNLKTVAVVDKDDDEKEGEKTTGKEKEKKKEKVEFSMHGRSSSFFPYGGGPSICPGRVFAKQEIIMTLAALVTRFEIELVGWTLRDGKGTPSDRRAENDQSHIGAVGIPPDRDMKIRWKRLW